MKTSFRIRGSEARFLPRQRCLAPTSKTKPRRQGTRPIKAAAACLCLALVSGGIMFAEGPDHVPVFENLGPPLKPKPVPVSVVTPAPDGSSHLAWAEVRSPERKGLLGVDVNTGKSTWIDLAAWDYGHIFLTRAPNGHLYLYTGAPAHFLKVDAKTHKLTDLGAPAATASYTMDAALAPDGRFFTCSFPKTHLVSVDTTTDQIVDHGALSTDARNKYATGIAVSDENIVYVAIGLHHAEVWAFDPATGRKKQILPRATGKAPDRARLTLGEDGQVYAAVGGKIFRCGPEGVDLVDTAPSERSELEERRAGDWYASALTSGNALLLRHVAHGARKEVPTDFDGVPAWLYAVCGERDGGIYGSGFHPAHVFRYDPQTGVSEDLGRRTGGRIQIYDILDHPRGLFLSSYSGAHLDFWNPETGEQQHIATLVFDHDQERGLELRHGPDGMIYLASRPSKGKVGGALTRIDPETLAWKCWRNVIPNHSVHSITSIPETGELFCTSSVYGGSGSVPVEKEGLVFLWNCQREEMVWKHVPIAGDPSYGETVRGQDGFVFVHAHDEFLLVDPVARKVVHRGQMPVKQLRAQAIADRPDADGRIYGLGDDALFAFDPAIREARVVARHPSVEQARSLYLAQSGNLYYVSGACLWRVKLANQPAAHLLFVGDFEDGSMKRYSDSELEDTLAKTRIVTSPVRAGKRALELCLDRNADHNRKDHRTDFWIRGMSNRFRLAEEYWFGFSTWFTESWKPDAQAELFVQWIGEGTSSPPLGIYIYGENYRIKKRWANGKDDYRNLWSGPVTKDLGKWTDWVFRVRWSHGKDGEIEVWKNGEKIVSDTGPNCGDVQLAPYFKFGIYKWPWNLPPEETPSTVTRRILVFDEIRIAAGIGGHALVKPPRAANK